MDWPNKADALADSISKSGLHLKATEKIGSSTGSLGVACSGGSDSLAVLLLVFAHFPELRSRITVLHFNHLLRGEASEQDAAFVEEVAKGLELEFVGGLWKDRDDSISVSEERARKARHAFFDAFVFEKKGALIISGHQQDDILETLLLRIARASNLKGLSAPKPVTEFANGKTMVRPLLTLSKAAIETALSDAAIPWREDASNADSRFDRNRLRNEVIPAWQEATQFDLGRAAAQVRAFLEEADEAIEHQLGQSAFPSPSDNPAELMEVDGPRAVLRRWFQMWIASRKLDGSISTSVVNEVLDRLADLGKGQWSASEGFIRVNGRRISFEKDFDQDFLRVERFSLSPNETLSLPSGAKLSSQWTQSSEKLLGDLKNGKYSESTTVLLDCDRIPHESFIIRFWQPGDRYQALNAPGNRKLQDLFGDRKIPKEERNKLPVVTTNDSLILWCPGLPVNHLVRVTEKTKEILQLTYTF
ncbi:MAG: tRNA lysidine(34) synthetase TilS [Verrucomicrobia bacterium]|nr:tRNA lysidine(34) synthetase TilS [Verrucomicrobiota bacterium]MDA1066094.1 tRNA lysidine(34) synthetase TilS [Verrucomicrobiota bacterium]